MRRSDRARRLALRVHLDGKVEVVAPRGVPEALVRSFVERHRDWVARKLESRARRSPGLPFPPPALDLPALGERYALHLAGGRGRPRVTRAAPGLLALSGRWESSGVEGRVAMLRWLLDHARESLTPRLLALAEEGGFRFRALQVRRQRTRWGSCSSRGVISLNVCGVFQSPEVLRYLMIHELVHTRHMNHSPAYWRAVAEHCEDWQRLDQELTRGWQRVPAWIFE